MEIEIRKVKKEETRKAAEILANAFAEDKGMIALFPKQETVDKQKLFNWFRATIKMQLENQQLVFAAFQHKELLGVAVISQAGFKPSIASLFKWTFSIIFSCGIKTVRQTILHDHFRQKQFRHSFPLILEFISVSSEHRGKGVGKALLKELQNHASAREKSIWLETTKARNIKIFEKAGFKHIQTIKETGTEYFIMSV